MAKKSENRYKLQISNKIESYDYEFEILDKKDIYTIPQIRVDDLPSGKYLAKIIIIDQNKNEAFLEEGEKNLFTLYGLFILLIAIIIIFKIKSIDRTKKVRYYTEHKENLEDEENDE